MNLDVFMQAAARGVPLLFVIFGIVQVMKLLKRSDGTPSLSGNALLLASLGWGLLLGVGYILTQERPPAGPDPYPIFVYWFGAVIYGIGLGLLAALFWDALKLLVDKAIERLVQTGLKTGAPTTPSSKFPS